MTETIKFKYSYNPLCINKDVDFSLLTTGYKESYGDIHDICKSLKRGYALINGNLPENKERKKENIKGGSWVMLDFDNSISEGDKKFPDITLSIEDALADEFIQKHAALIYTTPSHTTTWNRFRVVFLLGKHEESNEKYELIVNYLHELFSNADQSCNDISRAFFGNTNAEFILVNPSAHLPLEIHEDEFHNVENEISLEVAKSKKTYKNIENSDIIEALQYIEPRKIGSGNYSYCTRIAMAVTDYFMDKPNGISTAIEILNNWSPPQREGKTKWNVAEKVKTYRRKIGSRVSIASLFHYAKLNGWKAREGLITNPDNNSLDVGFVVKENLYKSAKYISVQGELYVFNHTHYEKCSEADEINKISTFCEDFNIVKEGKDGTPYNIFPFRHSSKHREAYQYVSNMNSIDVGKMNPPGVNCKNGIVRIVWKHNIPSVKLFPHSPTEYYNYVSNFSYNPNADTTECDRLLDCLNYTQQEVLLRNLGASLDLNEVRKWRSRQVKALLMCGEGSNGKDSIKRVVEVIFGNQGCTDYSLKDFEVYDQGKKFNLSGLVHSRINWASENPKTYRLDELQSLKCAITGNSLDSERKGIDAVKFQPKSVLLFNLNAAPAFRGGSTAIKTRFAVIQFDKSFVDKPTSPDELQADPRFADDLNFIAEKVAPAFLNKMIQGLKNIVSHGVDYDSISEPLKDIQRKNNHLWEFLEEMKITEDTNSVTTSIEVFNALKDWYKSEGIICGFNNFTKKYEYIDDMREGDRYIKSCQSLNNKLKEMFPKIKFTKGRDANNRGNLTFIHGLKFPPPHVESASQLPSSTSDGNTTLDI